MLSADLLADVARLADAAERRRFVTSHPELCRPEAVRALQVAARELGAREPRSALAVADTAVAAARPLDDDSRLTARHARAQALHFLSRYRESADLHDEVAREYEHRGDAQRAASAWLARIEALMYVGEASQAANAVARARALYGVVGDRVGEAKVDANEGLLFHRLDRFSDALTCYQRARRTFARRGLTTAAAMIDLNRALAHSMLGRTRDAARLFAAARAEFAARGNRLQVAVVDYNHAYDHFLNGRYDDAFRMMEEAHDEFASLGHGLLGALSELDLAEMSLTLGAPERARGWAGSARRGFEALGITLETSRARCLEAVALARTGAPQAAREQLVAACSGFAAEGHAARAALARLDLIALELADPPANLAAAARQARGTLEKAGFRVAAVRALLLEARAAVEPAAARRLFLRAERRARHNRLPDLRWQASSALARLDLEAGRPATARRRLETSVDTVDGLRAEVRRADLAGFLLSDRMSVYEDAMSAWLASGGDDAAEHAFMYAERARSRALADALAAARPARPEAYAQVTETPAVRKLRRRLEADYRVLLSHRRGALPDGELVARIARDEEALVAELGGGALAELTGQAAPLGMTELRELRADLPRGHLLLEYQRLGRELWAFLVERDGVRAVRLTSDAHEVDEAVRNLAYQLAKFGLGERYLARHGAALKRTTDGILNRLGELLLGGLAAALEGRDLIIVVPHGELHNVPFAALRRAGRYMIELGPMSVATSASVHRLLLRRKHPGRRRPLVVGVGDEQTPAVRAEAQDVAARFPGSRLLLGAAASRETFQRECQGRRLIHIATHGLFRPRHPTLSSLMLADGWLTLHDIAGLRLEADLVTVAACHSGRSEVGAGDNLVGLTRGFLHAGAASVLVSHWAVDDQSARRLMTGFYDRYARGEARASSLQAAMLDEMRERPHPYYWAAFSLVGAP